MTHGRGRMWAKRAALGVLALLAVGGGYAVLNWDSLTTRYAAYQFRSATSDDDRTRYAMQLLALGDVQSLTEPFRTDDAATCDIVIKALRAHLTESRCRPFLENFATFSDAGKLAVLELVPDLLKSPEMVARCRDVVKVGLASAPEVKVRAVRLGLRSEIALKTEVAALLTDSAAPVRRAAMLAVGTLQDGGTIVNDDTLFRFLHDPDSEVRDLCEAALMTRDFDHEQIQLARMLVDPNPAERLALARALERPDVAKGNPASWLERLARDPEPSVRVAVARVAAERALPEAAWRTRLAETDPDPTVRKLAKYYHGLSAPIRPVGYKD